MGIGIGVSKARSSFPSGPTIYTEPKKRKKKLPNPDPANYKIEKAREIGKYLLIEIKYPDCVNYEGSKILLYRDVTLIDLVNQKYIDPHFFENTKYASPIARFVPTQEGWDMGLKLIEAMK